MLAAKLKNKLFAIPQFALKIKNANNNNKKTNLKTLIKLITGYMRRQ